MVDIFDNVAISATPQDVFDQVAATPQDIFDEVTPKERSRIGEGGAALARGTLGMAEKFVGASAKFSPLWGKYGIRGALERTKPIEEQDLEPAVLTEARQKIKSAATKIPRTRGGLGGWAINTLGEGAPILVTSIATGGAAGWIGPATNMFIIAGESAYENAKAEGASEAAALRDYALSGLAESALEVWGVSKLLKFKDAGKGSLKLLVKNLKVKMWKKAKGNVKNITGNVLKSALTEGLEEASQSGASFMVEALPGGGKLPRKPDGSVDIKSMVKQIGMEAAGGALLGSVVPHAMNAPAGAVAIADPGVQKIEQAAKTIQVADTSPYEKARGINQLREMLPEDYQATETEETAEQQEQRVNVYQDEDGNNYNEDELVTKEETDGNRVPVAPNGNAVVLNPELSGSGIQDAIMDSTDPFYIPAAAQKVIDTADKFEKNLSEYEAKRPQETKEMKAMMGQKFAEADAILKAEIDSGVDPDIAMAKAKKTMEGYARTLFPEFQELFSVADMKTMRRAMGESTLTLSQKFDIDKVFVSLAGTVLPHPGSIRAFDSFFGTNITKIGKNKSKNWKEKMWRAVQEPGIFMKNILGSIDVSAAGIQGFPYLLAHPWQGVKQTVKGYRGISEDFVRLQDIAMKTHPYYNHVVAAGLPITEMGNTLKAEEEYQESLAHKIPLIGRWVKGSGRIHTTTLNGMRFNQMCRSIDASGESISDMLASGKLQEMAHHMANMTGRGYGKKTGAFEKHMDIWSAALWTPRMLRATVASPFDFVSKPHIRKEAAHDLVQGVAIMAGLTFLASLIKGWKVENDPRSSDFGKANINGTRIPILGRWGPMVVFISRMIAGKVKSTSTGEVSKTDRWDLFTRFLRGKLNPLTGVGADVGTGETFLSKKMRYDDPEYMAKYIAEHVTPLFVQDVVDAIRFQGLDNVNPLMVGVGAHTGMQTYETDARKQANELKNTYAHEYYGKDWSELSPIAQTSLRARQPMIGQYEEDAKIESESFGEWQGKQTDREYEAMRGVIKHLDKDVRKMYDIGIKIPLLKQSTQYRGSYWKMNLKRYEQLQKNLKPELEKAMRRLKMMPKWDALDTRIQRTVIEDVTKQVVKFARQKMINEINFADLEQVREGQEDQNEQGG